LEGDVFRGFEGLLGRPDAKLLGGDVLARWSRKISNDSSIQIQASYDRLLQRETFNSDIRQRMANVDLQHQFAVGRHNVIWGGGYRWQGDTNFPMPLIRLVPAKRAYPLETAFIQDEISLSYRPAPVHGCRNVFQYLRQSSQHRTARRARGLYVLQ